MDKPKIAIIIGTTRATRFGEKPAKWIHGIATARGDMDVELLDLRDYPMPFFDEPASNAWAPSKNEVAKRWQKKVAEFDGYLFVTAEYNRGLPAVLKNALDYAYPEWNRKPAAHCIELQMAPTRTGVHIQGADFMAVWQQGKDLNELSYLQQNAKTMLDELHWWASALTAARSASKS